jgi:hypothetical protein
VSRPITPPRCLATGVGALPHRDPEAACEAVISAFPAFPFVPTLPNRGVLESIVFTDSAQLPGRIIAENRLLVDTSADHSSEIEQVYLDYIEQNVGSYAAGEEYASGFHAMMKYRFPEACALKCQVTGPVTFGMQVTDCNKRPIFYDTQWADILGKLMGLRARWYEEELRRRTGVAETLVTLNEPYLAALGSSVVPLDAETVRAAINDVSSMLEGGLGIHCCSNTDWGFLLSLAPSVLSFDAYTTAREFLLYGDDIAAFMESGGVIAWGIVPAEYQVFRTETVDSLFEKFDAIRRQVCTYLTEEIFFRQSLITPTCGIRFADEKGAEEIMQTAAAISERVRRAID